MNQSIRQKDYEVSDNYLNHSEFAVELSLCLKLDPRSLQDPDTLGPLTFQTDPISFLSYAGAAFGRIKKLGFIVLSIPFGSVENERLWKVMTSVESKKRGSRKNPPFCDH